MDCRAALAMTEFVTASRSFCHCERSAAVQGPEFAVMDCSAALAMTRGWMAALLSIHPSRAVSSQMDVQ